MSKKLSNEEFIELEEWLNKFQLNASKLHRDFSDGVLLAALLKQIFPKLIDLHNYPPRNSIQLKLDNWETLNTKVLQRIGLQQSKSVLEKVSKSTPGTIERILWEIMVYEQKQKNKSQLSLLAENERIFRDFDEILTVIVNKKVGDAIVQVPQKMILYSLYEKLLNELRDKEVELTISNQKNVHLANVIQLKVERIDELCSHMAKLSIKKAIKSNESHRSSTPSSTVNLDESKNSKNS